jgi:adenylate cyclase
MFMTKRLSASKKLIRGLLAGLTGIVLSLALWSLGWLDTWEAKTWDRRVSFFAKPGKATDDIRLIALDQVSLDWGEEVNKWPWPWPREVFGAIVNYCRRSGVKALAFDVVFTEFSGKGVTDDESFGAAISEFGKFAGALALTDTNNSEADQLNHFPFSGVTVIGLEKWLTPTNARGIVFPGIEVPIPEVTQNSAILCNVRQDPPPPDGVYRQVKLFGVSDGKVFPLLGLGVYLAANSEVQLRIEPGRLIVGDKVIPIDKQGNAILRYRGPSRTYKTYSAVEVLQAEIRFINNEEPTVEDKDISNDLKDKYILFGYTAHGLYDLRPTPVAEKYPGVEINATVLDNFLSGDFIRKSPVWLTIILVVALAGTCATLVSLFSSPIENVVIGVVFLSIPVLFSIGSYLKGLWLPFAVQETAVAITTILALIINYATEGRQKRFIKDAFKHYLSPAVIEQLIQHPEQLKLGGERKVLSIFFSDLQGFTSISERLEPEELTAALNDYLSAMSDIIQEEQGTIDKYEGDAIIAFWNAPLNVPDHALRVVRAALRCQAKLAEIRPAFLKRIGKDLLMRIGINTGPAVVGNMGSHARFDYTMLGDAVNLAARLEGVNKQFGTYTMISQSTLDLLGDTFAVRELARVAVVGRKEPVTVYEPMLREEYEQKKQLFETFAQGLVLFYEGKFAQALEVFSTIRDVDPPAAAYAEKSRTYLTAPPEGWQGVWVMTSK